MDEFFRTIMGQRFFESTLPRLIEQLAKLNENIAALVAELKARRERDAE